MGAGRARAPRDRRVDLFGEQGYDETTVAQIAERAGVTRSTFFRHFPDKRELLVAGQATLSAPARRGHRGGTRRRVPARCGRAGLRARRPRRCGPMNHELGPRLEAVIASNAELQERSPAEDRRPRDRDGGCALARGVPEAAARLAAELGVLAFHRGFTAWTAGEDRSGEHLAPLRWSALAELRSRGRRPRLTPSYW